MFNTVIKGDVNITIVNKSKPVVDNKISLGYKLIQLMIEYFNRIIDKNSLMIQVLLFILTHLVNMHLIILKVLIQMVSVII